MCRYDPKGPNHHSQGADRAGRGHASCSPWSPATYAGRPSTRTSSPTAPRPRCATTACARSSRSGSPTTWCSKRERDLIAARPVIQSVASSIIGSRAFTSLFRSAVRDVHSAVFHQNSGHRHADGRGRRHGPRRGARGAAPLARREGGVDGQRGDRPARPAAQSAATSSRLADDIRLSSRGCFWSSRFWQSRAHCCFRPTGGARWSSWASGPPPPASYSSSPTA